MDVPPLGCLCAKCERLRSVDGAFMSKKDFLVYCARCMKSIFSDDLLPMITTMPENSAKSSTLAVLEVHGYLIAFNVPFTLGECPGISIVSVSTPYSVERMREMNEFTERFSSEMSAAFSRYPNTTILSSVSVDIGDTVNGVMKGIMKSHAEVQEKLQVSVQHSMSLLAYTVKTMFIHEFNFISKFPVWKPKAVVAVSPSFPLSVPAQISGVTATCSATINAVTPANSAVLTCQALNLMHRVTDDPRNLVPSVFALVCNHGWQIGVFSSECSRPIVCEFSGVLMTEDRYARQWALKSFVSHTEIKRASNKCPYYMSTDVVRESPGRCVNPIADIASSNVTACIMLKPDISLIIGSKNDGKTLVATVVGKSGGKSFSIFIEWSKSQWAHLITVNSDVVIVDGDIFSDLVPLEVTVEIIDQRSICPKSLESPVRTGAVEWTTTGWRGPCLNVFCQCHVI